MVFQMIRAVLRSIAQPARPRLFRTTARCISVFTFPRKHQPSGLRVAFGIFRSYGGGAGPSQDEAENRVLSVLKYFDKIDTAKLSIDTPFTQLGLDSLDVVEVMIALEEEFHMEIPDAVADKVQTPKEIAQYVYEFLNPHKPRLEDEDHYSEDPGQHTK